MSDLVIDSTATEIPEAEAAPVAPPTQRQRCIDACREMAEWLESHPDVPVDWFWLNVNAGPKKGEHEPPAKVQAARVASAMGKADKDYSGTTFKLQRDVGHKYDDANYKWTADRDKVCTPKVVGKKTVEIAGKPAQTIPAEPARTIEVDEIEWECEPLGLAKRDVAAIAQDADAGVAGFVEAGEEGDDGSA